MQWNNDRNYQHETQATDVYQDIRTPYSATFFGEEQATEQTQEFSLEAIKQKLGVFNPTETEENVSAKSDTKPSEQTLRMSYERNYTADNTAVKSRVNVKTKVMIASYAVIVLALILAVTLCGVAVSSSFAGATALYTEYVDTNAAVAELTQQVATEDYAALAEKAAELGYIDASRSNTQTYTEIETRPAQNFNVESNWFDALCDWISGAFGG